MTRYHLNDTQGGKLHGIGTALVVRQEANAIVFICSRLVGPNDVPHPLVLVDDNQNKIELKDLQLLEVEGVKTAVVVEPFVYLALRK